MLNREGVGLHWQSNIGPVEREAGEETVRAQ
jgi:hypothetical protein